jgi:hypothetical protein
MFVSYGLARALARAISLAFALALLLPAAGALAQDALVKDVLVKDAFVKDALAKDREPKEPLAILQFGAGAEWGVNGGRPGFGPIVAVEFTPVKNWFEVETGVAASFSKGKTEWDTDFIFKMPFDLSRAIEFEPGLGPVWIRNQGGGRTSDAIGAEAVFEFMFWPAADRKYGWFLEPSYTYSFARGHDQSFGVSGGLLIPIR